MVTRISFFIIVFMLFPLSSQDVKKKQKELQKIKNEIEKLEQTINDTKKKEKKSYDLLEKYSEQRHYLNRLLKELETEISGKEQSIEEHEEQLAFLNTEEANLKSLYRKYVQRVYRNSFQSKYAFLFSSTSISEAMTRARYWQKFSAKGKQQLSRLKEMQTNIASVNSMLIDELDNTLELKNAKESEEKRLQKKEIEEKETIKVLRNDQQAVKKELAAKKKAQQEIERLISDLVKKSIEKSKKETAHNKENKTEQGSKPEYKSTGKNNDDKPVKADKEILAVKGKITWPLSGGTITKKYGEQRNTKINTVSFNYGIDIKAKSDLKVRSVLDGTVSAIEWIPGYGSVVIVTHKGEFRTVYAKLSALSVKEGQSLQKGEQIGTVGESLDGFILHFEIWNNRSYQNPEIWLASR